MTTEEAYEILGLGGKIGAEDVKQAYRRRALEWHPDRFKDEADKERYAEKFRRAHEAYLYLRKEGFPELRTEAPPESPGWLEPEKRRFAPKEKDKQDVPLAEKLGFKFEWNWPSALLWCVIMPGGILGVLWMIRYIASHLDQ